MSWLEPITLQGNHCRLVPLNYEHSDELAQCIEEDNLSDYWYTQIPEANKIREAIEEKLQLQARGLMLPFTVFSNETTKVVGMTTFMNADPEHKRVEIGGTWYRKNMQRKGLNTECKALMLTHAFETLHCIAVELRAHFLNRQSRQAIERIGAKLDGVLRNHMKLPNGTSRDTCVYSIISNEWPAVKAHLDWLMNKAY